MTTDQAKELLRAYRPTNDIEELPEIQEALELAATDPKLSQWLEQEQAFDLAWADKLDEAIVPPAGLKEQILQTHAERSATEETSQDPGHTAVPFSSAQQKTAWWKSPVTLSMAASLIFIFGFLGLFFKSPEVYAEAQLPRFYEAVSQHVAQFPPLETRSTDLNHLREYLKKKAVPTPGKLPAGVSPLETIGCVTFQWENRSVAVICMGKPKVHHLYVIKRGDFPNESHPTEPKFLQKGEQALAAWADPENIYVLIVPGTTDQLEQIL